MGPGWGWGEVWPPEATLGWAAGHGGACSGPAPWSAVTSPSPISPPVWGQAGARAPHTAICGIFTSDLAFQR